MAFSIVIFASGSGSNAVNVCRYLGSNPQLNIKVSALFCNNPKAGVIEKMKEFNVPVVLFGKADFANPQHFLSLLQQYSPQMIALLGFLWKVPAYMVQAYPDKIINLHPALLPKFGGKGMYGHHVHEAVIAAREMVSGITLHKVNEHYDEGAPLAQFTCIIEPQDTAETLAQKIHGLEQQFVPQVIEKYALQLQGISS